MQRINPRYPRILAVDEISANTITALQKITTPELEADAATITDLSSEAAVLVDLQATHIQATDISADALALVNAIISQLVAQNITANQGVFHEQIKVSGGLDQSDYDTAYGKGYNYGYNTYTYGYYDGYEYQTENKQLGTTIDRDGVKTDGMLLSDEPFLGLFLRSTTGQYYQLSIVDGEPVIDGPFDTVPGA